jgi:hypothetical protein
MEKETKNTQKQKKSHITQYDSMDAEKKKKNDIARAYLKNAKLP